MSLIKSANRIELSLLDDKAGASYRRNFVWQTQSSKIPRIIAPDRPLEMAGVAVDSKGYSSVLKPPIWIQELGADRTYISLQGPIEQRL